MKIANAKMATPEIRQWKVRKAQLTAHREPDSEAHLSFYL